MTPELHEHLQEIFNAALELTGSSREEYLANTCQGDADLRARVEKLIEMSEMTSTMVTSPVTSSQDPNLPPNLGRYELLSQIGSGSMGIVYRAHDTTLDRIVALKVMRPESQLHEESAERFRREARACAQLSHPAIVTVYDLGEVPGTGVYIAMELLDGADWRAAMKSATLTVRQKVGLIAEVCDGLGHAHGHGIVHRDIKPRNLFLHGGTQAKILDFGIARLVTSSLTRTGKVLGTPNYMAPEQITGQKCDGRSDLFSTAIVSFEFLTGSHPFQAPFIPKRIVNDEPERLCDVDPTLPPELDSILSQALAKDPDDRFQTGEDFASALRAVLVNTGTESATV
jgi:eukaryotic-like serine/threonine-protein kinase